MKKFFMCFVCVFMIVFVITACNKLAGTDATSQNSVPEGKDLKNDKTSGSQTSTQTNAKKDLDWSKRAPKPLNWNQAVKYCKNLKENGHNDWRLPTIEELQKSKLGAYDENGDEIHLLSSSVTNQGNDILVINSENDVVADSKQTREFCHHGMCYYNTVHCVRNVGNEQKNVSNKENKDTKLQWSNKSEDTIMDWEMADNYCKNLKEGGHNDWKLPNIDELRSLIQNHSGTQTGGNCKINAKAKKLSLKYLNKDCFPRGGGNYSKMGDKGIFWSSSIVTDGSDISLCVDFDNGAVSTCSLYNSNAYIRCVR